METESRGGMEGRKERSRWSEKEEREGSKTQVRKEKMFKGIYS